MKTAGIRWLAGLACICVALFLLSGCGGEEPADVNGGDLDDDAAERLIREAEELEERMLDVAKEHNRGAQED